ncbi:MAG: S41 family peptidase [Bacteroidia bacterium]|nr:S41 family peptidase [Bacteroidia bacterium]
MTKENEKSLVALGQLWGFLKYHHPTVAEGKLDWDAELINILPAVMEAKKEDDWKTILNNWVNHLPEVSVAEKDTISLSKVVVKADYGELFNAEYFNQNTIDKLQSILDNAKIKENHYIKLNYQRASNEPFITITNEPAYEDMAFPDLTYRILALFRYWNIVNYFFPYRELCDTKWSEVLPEMLPDFVCAENQKEYTLACLKLSAKIDDSHGGISYKDIESYFEIHGRRKVPFETKFIENKLVVTSFLSDSVGIEKEISIGDIITTINGEKVEKVVERLLPYTPASNYEVKLRGIAINILQTNDSVLSLNFLQDGKSVKKNVLTYDLVQLKRPNYSNPKPDVAGYNILQDSVGYILPSSCKPEERESEVTRIMSKTKGLIIDLRCYPSDYNAMSIAPYLMKNWGYYCRQSFGNISFPGYFLKGSKRPLPRTVEPGSYPYEVVVMVNEYTRSQAEDHTFFYYLAPRVTIIGSTTAGANGAVFSFPLPGGLTTYVTGIGLYYPDGTCMQRAGIKIDEEIKPTIEGIKKGIDEPLERAIEIVKGE